MSLNELGIDIEACRQNLRRREDERYQAREVLRQAGRAAVLAAIQAVAPAHPEIRRMYLFGSITRPGGFGRQSDIDLAVEGLNADGYFKLWHEFTEAAPGWFIDLREIDQPSYFAESVRLRGELIYERED
jgi:predicted nucleotidyltransferase